MPPRLIIDRPSRLRTPRGIAVALLMLAYIFGGLLHCPADAGQFNLPASEVQLVSAGTADGHPSGKGVAAENHCHACFSVSIAAPPQVPGTIESKAVTLPRPQAGLRDRVPELDTPPPKRLT